MNAIAFLAGTLATAFLACGQAIAAPAAYPTPGAPNTVVVDHFVVEGAGPYRLTGYFAGGDSNYDVLGSVDINHERQIDSPLSSVRSNYGDSFDFGIVQGGDKIYPLIFVGDASPYSDEENYNEFFYSNPAFNGDGQHHQYFSLYAGDALVPAGFNFAWEANWGEDDFSYSEFSILFHVERATTAVPEPASWTLMIGGFGLAGSALRRRRVAA